MDHDPQSTGADRPAPARHLQRPGPAPTDRPGLSARPVHQVPGPRDAGAYASRSRQRAFSASPTPSTPAAPSACSKTRTFALILASVAGITVLTLIYQSQRRPTSLLKLSLGLQLGRRRREPSRPSENGSRYRLCRRGPLAHIQPGRRLYSGGTEYSLVWIFVAPGGAREQDRIARLIPPAGDGEPPVLGPYGRRSPRREPGGMRPGFPRLAPEPQPQDSASGIGKDRELPRRGDAPPSRGIAVNAPQRAARELTVESGGGRLDSFLAAGSTGLTRSQLRRLIDGGSVLLNGLPVKASQKVRKRRPGFGVHPAPQGPGPGAPVHAPGSGLPGQGPGGH